MAPPQAAAARSRTNGPRSRLQAGAVVSVRPRSLRTQLLAAIAIVVVSSAAISLAAGAVLTRRAVQHSILQDVSQQADLLAQRERVALLPLGPRDLKSL